MGSKSPGFLQFKGTPKSVDNKSSAATPEDGLSDDRPVGFLRSNRGIALVLILLVLAIGGYIQSSDWAHREVRDGFQLGSFPMFAVIMMFISLIVMLLDTKARKTTDGVRAFRLAEGAIGLALLAGLGGLFLLIPILGFSVVVFLIVFAGAILLGFRPVWIALATALGTAAALQGLTILLGVQFPSGLLSYLGV